MIGPEEPSPGGYVALGGICGLAWAASMRGWMAQLAAGMPHSHSTVTWSTLALVLLPGVAVGALLGRAAYLRAAGLPSFRPLIAAPLIFASALLDPHIFTELIRNGTGGGSLIVVSTALAIGYAMTRERWSVWRSVASLLGSLGLLVLFGMGGLAGPLGTPHGAWVSALGCSLVLLLGLAAALPHPSTHGFLNARKTIALGGLLGFTWAAGLRGFLAQVARDSDQVGTWFGTFVLVLLPGALLGAVLGWAVVQLRVTSRAIVAQFPPAAFTFAAVVIAALTASPLTARNLWLDLYLASLLAVFAGGIAIPLTAIRRERQRGRDPYRSGPRSLCP